MTITILYAILQIFGLLSLGALARRLGYFQDSDLNRWSHLAIDFLLPALAFHSITQNMDPLRFKQIWTSPFVALGLMVAGMLIGFLLQPRGPTHSPAIRRTFRHFCAMNNYSYLPIPIIQRLWGDAALADFFIFNLGSTIGYWTLGSMLLGAHSPRAALRQILSPNVIAILAATAICMLGWKSHIPEPVVDIAKALGTASIPLLVMLVGGGLYPPPKLAHKGLLAYVSVLRLLVIPAVNLVWVHLIPMSPELLRITCVVAVMPAAVTSVILARRYDGDPEFAAEIAVATTLLSAFTIPLALGWVLR